MENTEVSRQVWMGYASNFSEEKANDVQEKVFPKLDFTADFDLANESDKALNYLRKPGEHRGDSGIRLRNYDEAEEDMGVDIARAIKGYVESRSSINSDSETLIIV